MPEAPANTQVGVPNTRQRLIETDHGVLQVMVSWPLGWKDDGTPGDDDGKEEDVAAIPIILVLDGNAYFLTATDIVRRQQFIFKKKAIIVGIGYPDADGVYVPLRRSFDLTPPAKKGLPKWPIKEDTSGRNEEKTDGQSGRGGATKYWILGGAAHFHKTLVDVVLPTVAHDLLPNTPLPPSWGQMQCKVLFGHSFGGLFTLFSLFTDPGVFDVYMAASPSIWFNECSLVEEQEKAFLEGNRNANDDTDAGRMKKPVLYISSGTAEEDDVFRTPGDTDETFRQRQAYLAANRMNSNARAMAERLRASGKLADVWLQEFALEDHGSAAVVGLQRGINKLMGEWWEGK